MHSRSDQQGPFPVQRAFVVQFAAETPLESERMQGRVEHVVSREATTFGSVPELLDFITLILEQAGNDKSI